MSVRSNASSRLPKLRSAVTNNPRKLLGVDMRSARVRRYADIVEVLEVEFGADDPDALREIASLKLSLEDAQRDVLMGDAKAREDQVRLSNLITRRETALRAKRRQKKAGPNLKDYIAAKAAAAEVAR